MQDYSSASIHKDSHPLLPQSLGNLVPDPESLLPYPAVPNCLFPFLPKKERKS